MNEKLTKVIELRKAIARLKEGSFDRRKALQLQNLQRDLQTLLNTMRPFVVR